MQFPIPILTPVFMILSDSRRNLGLDIEFIDHFNTQLVITLNYRAIADLHTLQITVTHTHTDTSALNLLLDVS
jgi:hypothetical protein